MVKQLNRVATSGYCTGPADLFINAEGGIVYKEDEKILLFLLMSNLKLADSFYETAEGRLNLFEHTLDSIPDLKYKLALAHFMSNTIGIKLAPTLAITREAMRLKGKDNHSVDEEFEDHVRAIIDRPDKITNAMAYAQLMAGSAKKLPPFYKKLLKESFENFNDYTLRKFRAERKQVKLADAIKILHPKPANEKMSSFYKAIIENTKEASIEKGSVITEVLSDTSRTSQDKQEWIASNVEKIPINALLRNLTSVPNDREIHKVIARRVEEVLKVENGLPVIKIVNPFDIIKASINCKNQLLRADLDSVLNNYARKLDLGVKDSKVTFLVDVSGSMGGGWMGRDRDDSGTDIAALYLSFLFPALAEANTIHFYTFDTSTKKENADAYRLMTPLNVYYSAKKDLNPRGGTALVDSAKRVVAKTDPDILIIISDEVTWADTDKTVGWTFEKNAHPYVIMINPFPSGGTVFNKTNKVVKLSSLDAKLLYYIPALYDFKAFTKRIGV